MGEANVLAALNRVELYATRNVQSAEVKLNEIITMRRDIGDVFSEGADNFNFAITLTTIHLWGDAKSYCLKARDILERPGEENPVLQTVRLEKGIDLLREIVSLIPENKAKARALIKNARDVLEPTGEPPLFRMLDELFEKCN